MRLTARFAEQTVRLLAAAACVTNPHAARQRLDDESLEAQRLARPPHGWIAVERPGGGRWYTRVLRDEHGFELSGASGPEAPAGIDPGSIPLVPEGRGFDLEKRILQTRRLLHGFFPDRPVTVGPTGPSVVVEDLGDETRLALLKIVDVTGHVIREGCNRELRDAFLQPLTEASPLARMLAGGGELQAGAPDLDHLLLHFRAVFGVHERAMIVDAGVGGLFRLLDAALASVGTGTPSGGVLAGGFATHVASFRLDGINDQLGILIMYLRKCRVPALPQAMADAFLAEARREVQAALDAPGIEGLVAGMFRACHAAELAYRIHDDLIRIAGSDAPPMLRKGRNVAEEWIVRASGSIDNAFRNLEGLPWASHRHSVGRALAVGGAKRRQGRLEELVEMHWFYPRAFMPALAAPPPVASDDEQVLGPAFAAEYFRKLGYAAA